MEPGRADKRTRAHAFQSCFSQGSLGRLRHLKLGNKGPEGIFGICRSALRHEATTRLPPTGTP